LNDYQIGCAIL